MRMCMMLSWLTRRLVTSMSLSCCMTLTLRLTTSTTAGARPTTTWADHMRRSNLQRRHSKLHVLLLWHLVERFVLEAKSYETFETAEEIEEIVEEVEVANVISHEEKMQTEEQLIMTEATTTTTTTQAEVVLEHVEKDVMVDKKVGVQIEAEVEKKEEVIVKETGKVEKPAVLEGTSWFRRPFTSADTTGCSVEDVAIGVEDPAVGTVRDDPCGTSHAVPGTLTKVDGVWKRTVQVITTRKAHVDSLAPIVKTSYVYYDDKEVYYAVLVQKSTSIIFVTQLLFDNSVNKYYVYIRWGETKYKLDGPYDKTESAKEAFKIAYHEKFGVKWHDRETDVRGRFKYKVKTYETFVTTEEVEEIVEDSEAVAIIEREKIEAEGHAEEVVPEHAEKDVIVDNHVDIEANVEADVVDVEKVRVDAEIGVGTAADTEVEVGVEVDAEVEVEVDAEVVDDNEVKEEVVVDVVVAPSPSLPGCKISGFPASFGMLTTESLVSEMSGSPVYDDQSLGAMDLEEEPDILQFLVDRVYEDPDYTKLLLWTVYKLGAEGIDNQSTKNAMRILKMAGIDFQLQV
ncbi:hypothetical protein EDD21DRAFT_384869 [Dissophora ornata]|nr:hypothetical protein EDD21DRAFT_384869 [Dissophora ornata]